METLVAIFILLLAVTGPMMFAQSGLRAAYYSRDQITAFYLAQDSIEFIKNRKDHNILNLSSASWLDAIKSACSNDEGCAVYTNKNASDISAFVSCNANPSSPGCLGTNDDGTQDKHLKIDANGYFGDNGTDSIFSRIVKVEENPHGNTNEAKVTVIVRWRSHENIGMRSIEVVDYMYNWASVLNI